MLQYIISIEAYKDELKDRRIADVKEVEGLGGLSKLVLLAPEIS